jgi:hypothetical protein
MAVPARIYHQAVPTHHDVSVVPPQGAYIATRCPVRAQWDILRPCEPLPVSPVAERRAERGRAFEAEVLAKLQVLSPGAILVEGECRAEREATTIGAMRAGASLVLGGRLPTDLAGRRVGEPDVLVRAQNGAGYRPVDIKAHLTYDHVATEIAVTSSALAALPLEAAVARPGQWARKRRADLLQLAHYQRCSRRPASRRPTGATGGVYLWGMLVSDRTGRHAVAAGYRAFVTWEPLGPVSETSNFADFWGWLGALRSPDRSSWVRPWKVAQLGRWGCLRTGAPPGSHCEYFDCFRYCE